MLSFHPVCIRSFVLPALVCIASCSYHDASHPKNTSGTYLETKGTIMTNQSANPVSRKMYQAEEMSLICSYVISLSEPDKFHRDTLHSIGEFTDGDSIFYFDSADSTYFVLPDNESSRKALSALRFSGAWLWQTNRKTFRSAVVDSALIAGKMCQKFEGNKQAIWMYASQAFAIERDEYEIQHYERVVNYRPDSLFNHQIFKHPKGFKRIVPSAQ